MKKWLLISMAISGIITTNAQTMKDRIQQKMNGEKVTSNEFTSIGEIAKKWKDGSYNSRRVVSGMYQMGAKTEIKFHKENDEITSIEIKGDRFVSDATNSTPCVMVYRYKSSFLYLTNESILKYNNPSGNLFLVQACYGAKVPPKKGEKEIVAYREFAKNTRKAQNDEYSKNSAIAAEKAAAERKAEFGLHDKSVDHIELVVKQESEFGNFSGFNYDVIAHLKGGKQIKTSGLGGNGFWEDYIITVKGKSSQLGDLFRDYSNKVTSNVTELEGDYILISATLKKDPSIKDEKKLILQYNKNLFLNYSGANGFSNSSGERGTSVRVEAKAIKHSETNNPLVQYNVFDMSGKLLHAVRLRPDRTLKVISNGGSGTSEKENGRNGSDAGDITLVVDPSLKNYSFDYESKGGRGGRTKNPSLYNDGRDGRDGKFTKKDQKVNW